MRTRLIVGWLVLFSLVAAIGYAQQPAPATTTMSAAADQQPAQTLSLSEALDLARRNNPAYRQTVNDLSPARRALLNATSSLFLPSASLNGNYFWSDAGERFFQGISFNGPTTSQKSASINFSYSLSGASIAQRGLARADLRATEQDIAGAQTILETGVRTQYLNALEAQAQANNARRAVERANEQLNLARAKNTVGQGTLLEVRSAEVAKGTADVTLLRAEQNSQNQTLILFNQMGVPGPTSGRVILSDSFPVAPPAWAVDSLLRLGVEQNPSLRSLRARATSASWRTRAARSEYLPSLNLSAGKGRTNNYRAGFTQPSTDTTLPVGSLDTIPSSSTWSTNPWSFSVSVSLPIFDGFGRASRNSSARAAEEDARLAVRARELGVRSDIVSAFNGLQAAYLAVGIQANNRTASAEALELANQRYRVGSGSYLEVLNARVVADQADTDYIGAVYSYHRAIATLENAVGRPLR